MPLLQGTSGSGNASWTNAIDTAITTTRGVVGGTALAIGGRAFASTADSTALPQLAAVVPFDVTHIIPANTLGLGSVLKIRAVVRISTVLTAGTLNVALRLGGAVIVQSHESTGLAVGTRAVLEGVYTTRTAAGAAVSTAGVGTAVWSDTVAVITTAPKAAGAVPTFATDGALTVDVVADASTTGGGTGRYVLEQLYVEII